ncbi:MAG: hypothetical protein ACRCVX_07780 [Shewanella sp.]
MNETITRLHIALGECQAALELISMPKRADGTYNHDRAACQQLATDTLAKHGSGYVLQTDKRGAIQIGRYSLERSADGSYWIAHESGEGMQTTERKLEKLIGYFFYSEY